MNYKEVRVRVVHANGRFCIESGVGESFGLVALRESREVADALAQDLRLLLEAHVEKKPRPRVVIEPVTQGQSGP